MSSNFLFFFNLALGTRNNSPSFTVLKHFKTQAWIILENTTEKYLFIHKFFTSDESNEKSLIVQAGGSVTLIFNKQFY